ncbi:hypothetical protein EPZ47_02895 [Pseudomonas viciae]|uniref:Uncharacterized protein n=1 Tax=Pseudomonas viciae TaxID=2505979 RepID=A0A4P7PBC9_9PSED|nr:hypothetical protein EPZ47_02895 [Pseudomonas viciae]
MSRFRKGSGLLSTILHYKENPCGSELAREGGGSVPHQVTDVPLSRASSLPQEIFGGFER